MSSTPHGSNRSTGPGDRAAAAAPDPLAELSRAEGIPSAMAAARDAADAVLRDRGLRKISPELAATALLAGGRASAVIEQRDHPVEPVEPVEPNEPVEGTGGAGAAGVPGVPESEAARNPWLPGAIRISTELVPLAAEFRGEPGRVLARLHTLAARGIGDPDGLGRIDRRAAGRMADLQQLLGSATAAPALVLAAITHAEIATTEAFGPGSGLVARAAERLVHIGAGLDPRGVIVAEAGHLASGSAYRQALAGYATGGAPGVKRWLLHCADAFSYGVEVSPVARR